MNLIEKLQVLADTKTGDPIPEFMNGPGGWGEPLSALCREAIAAIPQWQPIDTAPKRVGKHLRMFGSGSNIHECEFIGVWHNSTFGTGWVEAYSERRVEPTHWMDLGPAPKVEA